MDSSYEDVERGLSGVVIVVPRTPRRREQVARSERFLSLLLNRSLWATCRHRRRRNEATMWRMVRRSMWWHWRRMRGVRRVRRRSERVWWHGRWVEGVGRPQWRRMEGRRRKVGELREVRSTARRDPGHVRWRGSAHRVCLVAVDGSISSLLLKWSGLRRRRPGAGFMEAPLVSATIVEGSTLDHIGWRSYDTTTVTGSKVSTALLFKHATVVERPGCLSHQTVGRRVRERAIRTWCMVDGNVPATERVLERAITTWCVVERNVSADPTGQIFSLSQTCKGTKSLAVGPRRNTARDLRARWWRRSARLRAARRKRNLKTVSHIVLQSTHEL